MNLLAMAFGSKRNNSGTWKIKKESRELGGALGILYTMWCFIFILAL